MKNKLLRQLIMLSKLTFYGIFLQCLFTGMIIASDLEAQKIKTVHDVMVQLDGAEQKISDLFNLIELNSDFRFTYYPEEFNVNQLIKTNKNKSSVSDVLLQISKEANLTFRQVNNNINVKRITTEKEDKSIEVIIQGITISGKVISGDDQNALPGVNVVIQGTTVGTVTDIEGNFSLEVPDENTTIVFSSVGYIQEEIIVGNRTIIDITLRPDITSLDEIVVIGYGSQRAKDLTGSVSTIRSEVIEQVPMVNVQQAMQGRMAGVQVQQNSGELDGNFKVLVRGVGTFSGANDPLYVVDGVPLVNGDLSNLNQNNIESINVLKDASATAIYGARASNGVVIVTTKKGKYNQKAEVTFNIQAGIDQPTKFLDVMDASQFAEFYIASRTNASSGYNAPPELTDQAWLAAPEHNHYWQDMITRNGSTQDYSVNISGGSESVNYSVTGGYLTKKGVLLNTDLTKATLGLNLNSKLSDKITTGLVLNASRLDNNYNINDFTFNAMYYRLSFQTVPWNPANDQEIEESKQYTSSLFTNQGNPARLLAQEVRNNKSSRLTGNVNLEFEIIENLKFKTSVGTDIIYNNSYNFEPVYDWYYSRNNEISVSSGFSENINWVADQLLTYQIKPGEDHHLNLTAGFSSQQNKTTYASVNGQGGTDNDLDQINNQPLTTGGGNTTIGLGLLSYFGRAFYSYKEKYLLTATIRRDASSRFSPGNKWGTFPSVALGWRISEESFLQNSFINNLKLRASYGVTGNQNIGNFAYLPLASTGVTAFGNDAYVNNTPRTFANNDLKWESANQASIGIDVGIFDNRINFTGEYYYILNEDILVQIPIPPVAGVPTDPTVNLGSLENKGFELSLSTINISTNSFTWVTDFNISHNENKIVDIGKDVNGEDRVIFGGVSRGLPARGIKNLARTQAGYEISSLWGYNKLGIWQESEKDEAASFNRSPGDTKYEDVNGDGMYSDEDMTYIGSPWPKFFGGISNTFSYKGFTLDAFFNFQTGNKLVNINRIYMTSGPIGVGNKLAEMYGNWWTPENPNAEFARPYQGGVGWDNVSLSREYIEDASFLRLKTLTLSYDLPNKLLSSINVRSATISMVGVNLWTLSNYKGQDPEGSSGNREYTNGSANNALLQGVDRQPYPFAKTYMAKLNITF